MRRDATEVDFYEGLIRKTAAIYSPRIQEDYEDIVQILRVKVWRALLVYDGSRSRLPIERYVFSCVTNQIKDLLKRKRRQEVFLGAIREDFADEFAEAYLSVGHDQVYADVERELPVIPNTLTLTERQVIVRLYENAGHHQIAVELELTRGEMAATVRSIREKMGDWRPTGVEQPVAVAA